MTRSDFQSVLRGLLNVEPWQVAELMPDMTAVEQRRMADDPVRFLLRADENRADAIWSLMAELTRVRLDLPVRSYAAAAE